MPLYLLCLRVVAQSAGVPWLDGYLNRNAIFSRGRRVNFAVAGSTALPVYVLSEEGILASVASSSLSTQLDWLLTYFNGICFNDDGECLPACRI